MKRKSIIILTLCTMLTLVGCSNNRSNNDLSKSDVIEIKGDNVKVKTLESTVKKDMLEVTYEWENNKNTDKPLSFLQTGVIFKAEQNGVDLDWNIPASEGLNTAIDAGESSTLKATFSLKNEKDPVKVWLLKLGEPVEGSEITVELD